jgi:2,4-dienoyl-CoA reductase-like NADH-dependent reductase (Old Yellow Enzyme family)/NADH dehydrogenase FAD-containing subunit
MNVMKSDCPNLLSPLKVGRTVWRNRIQTGPMSMTELGPGESLSDANIAFYERLARGGAAVVTIGESIVPSDNGKTHAQQLMLGNPEIYASLVRVVDAIHAHGALADIEISHGGYMADPIYNDGRNLMGPVALRDDYAGEVFGMDEKMLEDVAEAFASSVETVKKLGFDMAMIHAGHGWLLSQFLSPLYNTRTDGYGGSRENRNRFPLMVLERVRDRVGPYYTLDMRVSGSEFLEGGAEIEDCVSFCREAQRYVDVINVSAGAPWTKRMAPSIFDERGINSVFAAAVRKAVDIPVTTVGGFADPGGMEKIIAGGVADGIILGRGIVAEPDFPRKLIEGRAGSIHKCIRCYVCNESLYTTRNLRCSINPAAGAELNEKYAGPSAGSKRILIAGAGPGGMTAAITAARRGHRVTLFEKGAAVGGALNSEACIPFKRDMIDFRDTLAFELGEAGVDVRLNAALTPEIAASENPDAVFAAIGAAPIVPRIEGAEGANVMTADGFLCLQRMKGEGAGASGAPRGNVVIVGGGLVGTELALHLAMEGGKVAVLEMKGEIAADAAPDYRRFLLEKIEEQGDLFTIKTDVTCVRINEGSVICKPVSGDVLTELDAALVILAVGYASRSEEAEALRLCAPVFRRIGDCNKVARVYEAVRDGYFAGMI